MNKNAEVLEACKAGIKNGTARCRNLAGHCPSHPANRQWAPAPRPTVVLVKVNLDQAWAEMFEEDGVRIEDRTAERRRELETKHLVSAEKLGRDAYALRDGKQAQSPEAADSGCQIFGKEGISGKRTSVQALIAELPAAGFELTRYSILKRKENPRMPGKNPMLLVEFSVTGMKPAAEGFPWSTFKALTETSFNRIDVFANGREESGKVVHTVNCSDRRIGAKGQAQNQLRFADGAWAVELIATTANTTQTQTVA